MNDLKDYTPKELRFKLPESVQFPEQLFADCKDMDEVKKLLEEHFVAVQEKDIIANREMDEYEIAAIRENYGEIAEEMLPELESGYEDLKAKFNAAKKEFEAKISSLRTQFKDLVALAKKGIRDFPLDIGSTFRISVCGHYLYYTWAGGKFILALVQKIPNHEFCDLFSTGERNEESFKALGYELPVIEIPDTRVNLRKFGEGDDAVEVWEENGCDVWMEQWLEDFSDEDTGEVISVQRHEWHRVPFEESPWRKEDENDETGTQEGETNEVPEESEE